VGSETREETGGTAPAFDAASKCHQGDERSEAMSKLRLLAAFLAVGLVAPAGSQEVDRQKECHPKEHCELERVGSAGAYAQILSTIQDRG
jgi:hypothetical protein